ncbi:MAG: diacylglycerol kinase family lipid kinase [Candidatus Brocadiales bacterium]|nr:diacylglycerol kinase family lipid kinase [Candidatus Brocadiales bacterium]
MPKKLRLILNPIAGGGRALKILPRVKGILESRGFHVEVFRTQRRGDAQEVARVQKGEYSAVVAMGGDGTFNEVMNGALGSEVPLGLIPLGTANVLAKELRIPIDFVQASYVIAKGNTRWIDVGKTDHRHFTLMAGVGFDAEVVRRIESNRKGGISLVTYALPILETFWSYGFPELMVEVDGKKVAEDAALVFVSNSRRYTLTLRIAGRARVDDGLLDVCIFQKRDRLNFLRYTAGAMFWLADRFSDVIYLMGKDVRVSSPREVSYQIDGDLGGRLPARFQVVPRALPVLVPA